MREQLIQVKALGAVLRNLPHVFFREGATMNGSSSSTKPVVRWQIVPTTVSACRSNIAGRLKVAVACVMVLASVACSSLPAVRAEYDHQTDFSRYRTFGFFDAIGTDRGGYETLVTQTLKTATRRQMESRGYRYVEDKPDLRINFNAHLTDRVHVSRTPLPSSEYYGYRSYGTWRAYDLEVDQFTEGTLNIDIVDAARAQLVWEGIATGPVTAKVYQNRAAAIEQAVEQIFLKYPFSAQP